MESEKWRGKKDLGKKETKSQGSVHRMLKEFL